MRLEAVEHHIQATVRRALAEDIGSGDVTAALIPEDARASARVISREPHPGQVTIPSGFARGPIVALQRGQFMTRRSASIT